MPPPIRTSSLRVIDNEPRPEDLEPVTVDLPSNEIAPGVTLDEGVMHIEHGDGSTTIDFEPPEEEASEAGDGFYDNLVGKLEGRLDEIASELLDGIDRDIQ